DRPAPDAAAGVDAPAPDHLAAQLRAEHALDGGPQRPRPCRLPPAVRAEHEARRRGLRGAQAGPVGGPDPPPQVALEPGGPHVAVEVRPPGQARPLAPSPGWQAASPAGTSRSSSSSSRIRSAPPMAAT